MKLHLFSVFILFLLTQSCCLKKGEETNRVTYSVEDKMIIPYANDQTVDMITDEDFQFQFNVSTKSSFYSDQEHCEDYTSYEDYKANLVSELPSLDVNLRLNRAYNDIDDNEFIDLRIEINRFYFFYNQEQPLETLEINGATYTDVFHYYPNSDDNPISDVFFNTTNGLLKIDYTNGDYVQIN
jgi:hypothetical protein